MEKVNEQQPATRGDERGHDTKGSRKALGAMNAKLRAKVGRLERELAALSAQLRDANNLADQWAEKNAALSAQLSAPEQESSHAKTGKSNP